MIDTNLEGMEPYSVLHELYIGIQNLLDNDPEYFDRDELSDCVAMTENIRHALLTKSSVMHTPPSSRAQL